MLLKSSVARLTIARELNYISTKNYLLTNKFKTMTKQSKLSKEVSQKETPKKNNGTKTPQKTTAINPPKTQLSLNLAHLLFLHGMVAKFYELDDVDDQMKDFLHDLLVMFEIYIEQVPNEKLFEKFNYSPIHINN